MKEGWIKGLRIPVTIFEKPGEMINWLWATGRGEVVQFLFGEWLKEPGNTEKVLDELDEIENVDANNPPD